MVALGHRLLAIVSKKRHGKFVGRHAMGTRSKDIKAKENLRFKRFMAIFIVENKSVYTKE